MSAPGAIAGAAIPEWRGVAPGTAWLGPDVLWRPREWLVFHLQDEEGGGFRLDLTARDMNTYQQGERPLLVWVIGPDDRTLVRVTLPDDGVISGADAHRDGIYDPYADFRYREWHRVHSPGGRPPGKERSSYLTRPQDLPARELHVEVPDAGAGLYRAVVIASWDHWISLTPDRPLATGVHPGPGPLYVHGDRFASGAYLWIPETTGHLGVSVTEETQPFASALALRDESGALVAERRARTFQTYVLDEAPETGSVYELRVTAPAPGVCLHILGVPPVLCPDAETARRLHGGLQIDASGRHSFHHHQRVLDRWADDLDAATRADSTVAVVLDALDALRRLSPFFWYNTRDVSYRAAYREDSPFTAPTRSGWYGLGLDSRAALALREPMAAGTLPDSVVAAWQTALSLWAGGHWRMHSGETSNQWTYTLNQMRQVLEVTRDPALAEVIRRDVVRLTTTGSLGRLEPDGDPDWIDLGRTPAGYMAEQMGWDGQYGVEQVSNLGKVWRVLPEPSVVDWWNDFYWLKTHITLPKRGVHTTETFNETVSPTDFNFRTRYYTHKTGLPSEAGDAVVFGDLWKPAEGMPPARPWPQLEDGSFVRSVADVFHFVKTSRYYAVVYSGPRLRSWAQFTRAIVEQDDGDGAAVGRGGHARLAGYGGPGYGGFERKTTKVGAFSAVWVPGTGATLLAQNHNVMDAHTVWGRRHTPITPVWAEGAVDPTVVCSGFAQPEARFDAEARVYDLREELRYAPLVVERRVHFAEDRITIDLKLEATAALDLGELYLAFPYVADDREVRRFDADLEEMDAFEIPASRLTHMRNPDREHERRRFEHPPVRARAIDFAGAGGAGTTVLFEREWELMQAAPVRYREIASATGSLNLPLPTQMAAGETHSVRYVIYAHAEAITSEDLREMTQNRRTAE